MGVVGYGSSTYLKIMVIEHNINWKATSSNMETSTDSADLHGTRTRVGPRRGWDLTSALEQFYKFERM